MKLQPDQRIDHYTVIRELGKGGMSDVYLAHDDQNSREVVLKFPHEDMMGDPATYERFCREVKIGERLNHPNIQRFYELAGNKLAPYLVLEYVPGSSMRDFLRQNHERRHPLDVCISLGTQIARALTYAHENNVFHRDLKPENIIVTPDSRAKVMDFGIAFVKGARRVTWGRLSAQVGTPDYMAPEQIKGQRGDHRTDIYALGMMLYECIAGRLPYDGDNALAVMNQHVTVSPPPLHRFRKDVPPALEEAVMKAIRRDPNGRWPSMQALVEALEHPESVDVAGLKAERERDEGSTSGRQSSAVETEFGVPPWQIILIVLAILSALVILGVIAQFVHHGPS